MRGYHRHPDLGPGRRGAAANRRGLHLRPVRSGHYWHRPTRGPCTRSLRRLRPRRGARLDYRPRPQTARGQGVLRHIAMSTLIGVGINFVGLDPIKALFWSAVINGVVAVPLDGDHHANGNAPRCDGPLCAASGAVGVGVVEHGDDGGCGCDHVCDLVRASGGAVEQCASAIIGPERGSAARPPA